MHVAKSTLALLPCVTAVLQVHDLLPLPLTQAVAFLTQITSSERSQPHTIAITQSPREYNIEHSPYSHTYLGMYVHT